VSTAPNTRDIDEVLASVTEVEGWLTEAQARRLWTAAQRVAPGGRVVEIGSFRGRSTIVLASAAEASVDVVAIDPHGGGDRGPNEYAPDERLGDSDHATFHANLARAGVENRVRHVRRPSAQALGEVDGAVDMLFIDGAHRYAFAKPDIALWGARVTVGGSMLIHDSFNAVGVMLAQLRLLLFSREFRYVGRSGSLAEYRRQPLGRRARIDNVLGQLAELPYFVRNCVVKAALAARLAPVARLLGEHGHWPY
jgi:predicted O-methyltransferase YrrM